VYWLRFDVYWFRFDVLRRGTPGETDCKALDNIDSIRRGTPGETDCKANVDLRRRPLMTASRQRLGDDDGDQFGDDNGDQLGDDDGEMTTATTASR
jgi:hypothetical protein